MTVDAEVVEVEAAEFGGRVKVTMAANQGGSGGLTKSYLPEELVRVSDSRVTEQEDAEEASRLERERELARRRDWSIALGPTWWARAKYLMLGPKSVGPMRKPLDPWGYLGIPGGPCGTKGSQ